MKAKVSIKNYKNERKNLPGEIEIKDNQIYLKILNIDLFGHDVDRDSNEEVVLNGDSHQMILDWKGSYKLVGKWKSDRGNWSTVTITIEDLKRETVKTYWDDEAFIDMVDIALVTLIEGKLANPGGRNTPLSNWEIMSALDFIHLKRGGIYFSPYYQNQEAFINRTFDFQSAKTSYMKNGVVVKETTSRFDSFVPFTQMSLAYMSEQDDKENLEWINQMREKGITRLTENSATSGHLMLSFLKKIKPNSRLKKGLVPMSDKPISKKHWFVLYELGCREQGEVFGSKRYVGINFKENKIHAMIPGELAGAIFNIDPKVTDPNLSKSDWEKIDPGGRIRLGIMVCNRVGTIAGVMVEDFTARQSLWVVEAFEDGVRSAFGVNQEQVKSLFYAASRPLTASGRRSAILHWIRSHLRRIKGGIEIKTIPKSLRGESNFAMSGTQFQITKPLKKV